MNFKNTSHIDIANYTKLRSRELLNKDRSSRYTLTAECENCGRKYYKSRMIEKEIYGEKIYYCSTCIHII